MFLLPSLLMGKPSIKIKGRDNSFKHFCIQSKLGVQAISIMFWDEMDTEISWALTNLEYLSDNNTKSDKLSV